MIEVDIEQSKVVFLEPLIGEDISLRLSDDRSSRSPSLSSSSSNATDTRRKRRIIILLIILLSFVLKLILLLSYWQDQAAAAAANDDTVGTDDDDDDDVTTFSPSGFKSPSSSPTFAPTLFNTTEPPTAASSIDTINDTTTITIDDGNISRLSRYEVLLNLLNDNNAILPGRYNDTAVIQAINFLAYEDVSIRVSFDSIPLTSLIERFAVVVFYYATSGNKSWNKQIRWLWSENHICDWYSRQLDIGIFCSNDSQQPIPTVEKLYIIENNLIGTMPPELSLLSNLKVLDLRKYKVIDCY